MKDYVIGEILENGEVIKNLTEQGMVYKNSKAFYQKLKEVCYIPELSDTRYTYEDFLSLTNGSEEVAEMLFATVDWQSPEVLLEESFAEGEVHNCLRCKKMYLSYNAEYCPNCGQIKEQDVTKTEYEIKYDYQVDDTEYEVILYKKPLEKANWSWESLIFPENDETFAIVTDKSTKQWSHLTTNGFVRVIDTCEERDLSIDEIRTLSMNSKIYNERYVVDYNNWFAVEYLTEENNKVDDVFEAEPKTFEELAHYLLDFHLNFFKK